MHVNCTSIHLKAAIACNSADRAKRLLLERRRSSSELSLPSPKVTQNVIPDASHSTTLQIALSMPNANPPARVWCLRFKLNRSTILLHVDALQTLSSVRAELLVALQATNPDGIFKGTLRDGMPVEYPLPANPEDIVLAKPKDINDLNAGWETIGDLNDELVFDEDVGSKGKGKATAAAKASSKNANDCPQGAGLRDAGVVAFRFRLPDEKARRQRLMDGDLDVDEIAKDGMGIDDSPWDVIVPTMEETYGDEE